MEFTQKQHYPCILLGIVICKVPLQMTCSLNFLLQKEKKNKREISLHSGLNTAWNAYLLTFKSLGASSCSASNPSFHLVCTRVDSSDGLSGDLPAIYLGDLYRITSSSLGIGSAPSVVETESNTVDGNQHVHLPSSSSCLSNKGTVDMRTS